MNNDQLCLVLAESQHTKHEQIGEKKQRKWTDEHEFNVVQSTWTTSTIKEKESFKRLEGEYKGRA